MFRIAFCVDEFVTNGFIGCFVGEATGRNGRIESIEFNEDRTIFCHEDDDAGEPVCRCDIDQSLWAGIVGDVRQHIEDNFSDYSEDAERSERGWHDSLVCDVRGR